MAGKAPGSGKIPIYIPFFSDDCDPDPAGVEKTSAIFCKMKKIFRKGKFGLFSCDESVV
ncbi:MAG: hypothetical protein IJE17_09230 [Clostridia bacterium]|nr:hypothetical protein [Clostridia bacterium]